MENFDLTGQLDPIKLETELDNDFGETGKMDNVSDDLELPISQEKLSTFPMATQIWDMSKKSATYIKDWMKENKSMLKKAGYIVLVFSASDVLLTVMFYKSLKKEDKGKVYRYNAH